MKKGTRGIKLEDFVNNFHIIVLEEFAQRSPYTWVFSAKKERKEKKREISQAGQNN